MATPDFYPAGNLVAPLLLGQIFYQWVPFSNLGLLIKDRTKTLARIAFFSVVVMVTFHLLLIPSFGPMGAAFAVLGGFLLRYLAVLFFSQRSFAIGHGWRRILKLYGVMIGAILIDRILPVFPLPISVLVSGGLTLAAYLAVWVFLLHPAERSRVLSYTRSALGRIGVR